MKKFEKEILEAEAAGKDSGGDRLALRTSSHWSSAFGANKKSPTGSSSGCTRDCPPCRGVKRRREYVPNAATARNSIPQQTLNAKAIDFLVTQDVDIHR